MATEKKVRINITIQPELADMLLKIGEASNMSRSEIIEHACVLLIQSALKKDIEKKGNKA